jgi:hypothetical protein
MNRLIEEYRNRIKDKDYDGGVKRYEKIELLLRLMNR